MPFLTGEEMQERLNELATGDITEKRKVELITELGQQHASGLQEYAEQTAKLKETQSSLGESRDAMATMYNKINATTFGGAGGKEPEEDTQATITVDDLLGGKK